MPELGPELSALLDEQTGSPDSHAQRIAQTPALLAEARQALPMLKAVAERKAERAGVMAVISKRFALYTQPQRNEAEWDAWWADYFDVLADVPLASLEAGMRQYVADPASEFIPKPGKLRELAFTAPCRSLARYYRASRAIRMAEEAQAAPVERVDPAQVRQMLAEFETKAIPPTPKPEKPNTAGKVDETGITPQMREAIARRQEMRR